MLLCKYCIIEKRLLQKNLITRLSPKRVLPEKGLLFYVIHNGSFPVQWCASVPGPHASFLVGTCYRENCRIAQQEISVGHISRYEIVILEITQQEAQKITTAIQQIAPQDTTIFQIVTQDVPVLQNTPQEHAMLQIARLQT